VDETLRAAYAAAVYEAELPAGRITFRVGAVPRGPAPVEPLAIVTAYNPGHARPGEVDNRAANERLAATLARAGWDFHPALGRSADGRHREPSFAVAGIDVDRALAIARRFGQAAILYWNGSEARLAWTDARRPAPRRQSAP